MNKLALQVAPPRRYSLGNFPTPLMPLRRLSAHLKGPQLFMKRDDLTGLAFGGNKTRKLEFFIADALNQSADCVITAGAAQSNHCRQTAAACATTGLECHLILGGEAPNTPNGNVLIDLLMGAHIHWRGQDRKGQGLLEVEKSLRSQGRKPYSIPYGGSNAIGAQGFVEAVSEFRGQLTTQGVVADRVVFASSSGGTQAGLVVGGKLRRLNCEWLGIGIDKNEAGEKPYVEHMLEIAGDTAELIGLQTSFSARDFIVRNEFVGGGYGVMGELEREAISLTARLEGILLDPVYTGRAMGAMIDLIRQGEINKNETVVFWHTGGGPALFEYAQGLL